MWLEKLCVVVITSGLMVLVALRDHVIQAQSLPSEWVYSTGFNNDQVQVYRTSIRDGTSETYVTIPIRTTESLSQILPTEELEIFSSYLKAIDISSDEARILTQPADVELLNITVAPDGTTLALNLQYKYCTNAGRDICFGVNRLATTSESDRNLKVQWEIGLNTQEYAPSWCRRHEYAAIAYFAQFRDVRWSPDQSTLFVSIGGDIFCFPPEGNQQIIAVPLDGTHQPVSLGTAISWTVFDQNTVAGVYRDCADICTDTISLRTPDYVKSSFSEENVYILGNNTTVAVRFGFARVDDTLVFVLIDVNNLDPLVSLASFNPQRTVALQTTPLNFPSSILTIKSSPSHDIAVIQTLDGSLWLLSVSLETHDLTISLLVQGPVSEWTWSTNESIVYQESTASQLNVITVAGEVSGTLLLPSETTLIDGE
jgi:hypothetical protein